MLRKLKIIKVASVLTLSLFVLSTTVFAAPKSKAYQDAQSLMDKEDFKPAIAKIISAQKAGEDTIHMSLLLTEAYAGRIDQVGQLKKMKLAKKIKKSTQHSLELAPNNVDAMEGLIQFHIQAPGIVGGDKKEAHKLLAKFTELKPIRGHMLSARLLIEEDKLAEANAHIVKAIALDPANTDVLESKAGLEVEQGLYSAAISTYEACLLIENDNWNCRYQLGKASQVGQVEYDKGKAAFLAFIENGSANKNYLAYAHYRLGNIYKQTGDTTEAKRHYQSAIEIDNLKKAKNALSKMK